ncbi:MAG: DUF433 domain-containing protein [Prosthecobacter sp.]|nr:DUF433 domain-containing protein [Prosthecobacter sp.]
MQESAYIENNNGVWRVRGSRVSLASIVRVFREGMSAESISRECFPSLSLEQVYGAITHYLANRREADRLIASDETDAATWQVNASTDPMFSSKMAATRAAMLTHA